MSQAGIVDIEASHPQIPTSFVTDMGTAIPIGNVLEVLGTTVAAHSIPLQTTGSGNTVTIKVQYASAAGSSVGANAGVASFSSAEFNVDANGFVTLKGSVVAETITGNTGGALSPTAGNWNILGISTVAGTTPVQTAGSGSTLTIQVQKSQAIASTNATNVGLAAFNSTFFTVDANGFVSINGAAVGETITGNTGGALSPTAGNWNILGTSTVAGTTPVQTAGSGSTLTVQVQKSQAIAATDATKVGLANFNSADFSVDANGFVSAASTGYIRTITGTTGGAESPAAGGNFNLLGSTAAAGTTPVVVAGSANTETIKVQISQAIASTDATKIGLAAFDSAAFTVDSNGFVSLSSTGDLRTLSDDVGTSITPSGGNIQLVGHVVEQGATKFSTVVAGSHLANINPMSSSRWIVDPLGFNGTHTTISSAITSATSGDTIFILPGTYTENPTLKAGVNLAAYECDAFTPNVTIVGKCTMTTAGTVTLTGINLQTNSDFLLAVTGSAASLLNLISCNLNISNNTGISFTSSSPSALITLFNCTGNIGTTGITTFVSTSAGVMVFRNCYISNPGTSTTASSTSTGIVAFFNGLIGFPCSTSSTGNITTDHCSWNTGTNIACLATTGTAGAQCQFTEFQSGTDSALSIGSGTTVVLSNCNINSSNTNAIAGSGSLTYVGLSFYFGSSQVQNTLTLSLKGSTPSNAASGFIWTSTGTNTSPTWQAASNVGTVTQFDVLVGGASGAIASVGPGSTGQILQSGGNAANPVYSTATYPSTATTAQQLLVANGTNWVGKALSLNTQVFTSSGIYTPTPGLVACNIECVGGGGGGGGTANSGATGSCTGGGGGGGAYSRKFASAATIGASQTVTIPASAAGGVAGNNSGASPAATTVGTICTANGGSGGGGNVGGGIGAGGSGGTVGTGDFSVVGEAGGTSIGAAITTVIIPYAGGGASCLGFGGAPLITAGATTGNAGQLYGGGGGGGASFAAAGTAAGGAGGKGIVIITEYVIA